MKFIAIFLMLLGLVGLGMGAMMFGDIGVAAGLAGLVGGLSGTGFWLVARRLQG